MRNDLVLRVVGKMLIPFILLFALYVQFHGDFGPGGGFQAGVILAAAVIFYALVFYIHMSGQADPTNVALAWAYVGFRVAHSLFQALVNFVPVRFALFALGTFALMGLAVRCVMKAFG